MRDGFGSTWNTSKIACMASLLGVWLASTPARAEESLTYLETAGRYVDLQHEAERVIAEGKYSNVTPLGYLCIAYGKLKQYEKLFACTTEIDQRIGHGDHEMELDQRVMFIAASDIRPLPDTLRARAYFELGDFPKAILSGTRVLEILSRIPETGGTSLYPTVRYRILALEVLGLSAARMGDLDLAMRYRKQLEDVSKPFIGGRMWGWIKNNSLAQLDMALGLYAEALAHIPDTSSGMKLIVSFVNSLGPYAYKGDSTTTVLELPRRVMRATALLETGKPDEAKKIFDEILESRSIKDFGDLYWISLFERGRIAELETQPEQAASFYRKAIELIELQRSSISTEGSKIGFVGDKQQVYARLIAVLIRQGHVSDAFDFVERSKSRALVDMLGSKKDFAGARNDEKTQRILEQLDSVNLAAPVDDPNGGKGVRSLQLSRDELRKTAPELSSLVTVSSISAEQLRQRIGKGETLVEYYYEGKDLYVFLLNSAGLSVRTLDGAGLDQQVQSLRWALRRPNSDWQTPSRALYQTLWKPIESSVATKNVIIVAHGALHYIPFAALQRSDGALLIDQVDMSFLPSASVLQFLRSKRAGSEEKLLVFGNPNLGKPELDLKFAEIEARSVAGMSKPSQLLLRQDASESNFRNMESGFQRFHFATHGSFSADDPLNSGIYLAKDANNDGVLTVGDLYAMHLDADLVTLSACDTGLGKISNGDDVVGLVRGFLYAGSNSVVASLWSVDDKATAELMQAFYQNFGTLSKREALRLAQIKTRQDFPHPFFWAAFQLTGQAE